MNAQTTEVREQDPCSGDPQKDQTETFVAARKKAKAKDLQVHPLLDLVSIAWGCQYRAYCVQTIKHGCRPVPLQTVLSTTAHAPPDYNITHRSRDLRAGLCSKPGTGHNGKSK